MGEKLGYLRVFPLGASDVVEDALLVFGVFVRGRLAFFLLIASLPLVNGVFVGLGGRRKRQRRGGLDHLRRKDGKYGEGCMKRRVINDVFHFLSIRRERSSSRRALAKRACGGRRGSSLHPFVVVQGRDGAWGLVFPLEA